MMNVSSVLGFVPLAMRRCTHPQSSNPLLHAVAEVPAQGSSVRFWRLRRLGCRQTVKQQQRALPCPPEFISETIKVMEQTRRSVGGASQTAANNVDQMRAHL